MIIDNVTDKNPEDYSGITPLHWAAHYGHLSICQLIMKNCDEKKIKSRFQKVKAVKNHYVGHLNIELGKILDFI